MTTFKVSIIIMTTITPHEIYEASSSFLSSLIAFTSINIKIYIINSNRLVNKVIILNVIFLKGLSIINNIKAVN